MNKAETDGICKTWEVQETSDEVTINGENNNVQSGNWQEMQETSHELVIMGM